MCTFMRSSVSIYVRTEDNSNDRSVLCTVMLNLHVDMLHKFQRHLE